MTVLVIVFKINIQTFNHHLVQDLVYIVCTTLSYAFHLFHYQRLNFPSSIKFVRVFTASGIDFYSKDARLFVY